ncbi:MAG TPA: hypothetical protein VLA95_05200 [Gemmatimonadales bacterium]|nr:hypothetical protein [Gemmatimonadales bacterium]
MKQRLARWRGIIPLFLLLVLLGVGYVLFADRIARDTVEETATEFLGTQVDLGSLRILERETAIELTGLEVADPFDRNRNALSAAAIRVVFEPKALLEKKLVITELAVAGAGVGTRRDRPARAADPDGFAAQTLGQVLAWRKQFDIPALLLPRVDTLRQLALDPAQLATVQAARALAARADSLRDALEAGVRAVPVAATLDSARAVLERLRGQSPATLGVSGTRQAVADVRRVIGQVDTVRARVAGLGLTATQGIEGLDRGLRAVDAARLQDIAFARSLLRLPSFDAPDLGKAVFGDISIDKFQQALYWLALAREYLPPGLDPRQRPGPARLRLDGTDVGFPKAEAFPAFHIAAGQARFSLTGANAIAGSYLLRLTDVTTEPALVGRPVRIAAERLSGPAGAPTFTLGAVLDHRGVPRDSVAAAIGGVRLPGFGLPQLPFRIEPGRSDSRLFFRLAGDDLRARWTLRAADVRTLYDSARGGGAPGPVETLIGRLLATLPGLEIEASLEGPVARPAFRVSSNLDRVLSERLRAAAGEELARAEAFARAKVDSVAQAQLAVLRVRADSLRAEGTRRYDEARARLETERAKLNEQLARLGVAGLGDVIPMPQLPGIPGLPGQKRDTTPADSVPPDTAAGDSGGAAAGE